MNYQLKVYLSSLLSRRSLETYQEYCILSSFILANTLMFLYFVNKPDPNDRFFQILPLPFLRKIKYRPKYSRLLSAIFYLLLQLGTILCYVKGLVPFLTDHTLQQQFYLDLLTKQVLGVTKGHVLFALASIFTLYLYQLKVLIYDVYCLQIKDFFQDYVLASITDFGTCRNRVLTPLIEELSFRMVLVYFCQANSIDPFTFKNIMMSSFSFGVAHISMSVPQWKRMTGQSEWRPGKLLTIKNFKALLNISLGQLLNAFIFGIISLSYYNMTRNVVASVITHQVCNTLGSPEVRKKGDSLGHLVCVIGYVLIMNYGSDNFFQTFKQ